MSTPKFVSPQIIVKVKVLEIIISCLLALGVVLLIYVSLPEEKNAGSLEEDLSYFNKCVKVDTVDSCYNKIFKKEEK